MNDTKPELVTDYYRNIFNGLGKNATIRDAVLAMRNQGNTPFFKTQRNVLNPALEESVFTPNAYAHEMMHIAGEFPHTPYGEEFNMVATDAFDSPYLSINGNVLEARDYSQLKGYYLDDSDMKQRAIKPWEANYAAAVGVWMRHKITEYMLLQSKSMSADEKEDIAERLQSQSPMKKIKAPMVSVSGNYAFKVDPIASELPAKLLELSPVEKRALITIATGDLSYNEGGDDFSTPAEFKLLENRIRFVRNILTCNYDAAFGRSETPENALVFV